MSLTTRLLVQRSHTDGPQAESGPQKGFVRYVLCFKKKMYKVIDNISKSEDFR